jgi:hypothetical protein
LLIIAGAEILAVVLLNKPHQVTCIRFEVAFQFVVQVQLAENCVELREQADEMNNSVVLTGLEDDVT